VGVLDDGLSSRLAGRCKWPKDPHPKIPRISKGVEERVNKLKALGNAIVPQVAFQILKIIAEIENRKDRGEE
jgi:hypothetical protein